MALSTHGVSRQHAHEEVRLLSHEAAHAVKVEGRDNDLIERIRRTAFFEPIWAQLDELLDPRDFVGRAPQQVEKFCGEGGEVSLALRRYEQEEGILEEVGHEVRLSV